MAVKIRMIFIGIVSCISIIINGFAQSSLDTIRIQKDLVEIALHSNYSSMNGSYTIKGKTVDKTTFEFISKKLDSISRIVYNNTCKYYIFLSPDNKAVEEGWWCVEFFSGYYKSYFQNGNVKEEGYYTDSCDSIFLPGQKIGKWKYYSEKGVVRKITDNTPTGYRVYDETEPNLPPCICSQKMLYKDRNCVALPPSKLRGTTFYYSSAVLRNKKIDINEIKNDSLIEFKFLLEYGSEFMDSVYSKGECINDGVFVIKIFKHRPKDTLLEFSMSYVKKLIELNAVLARNYITIKGRKVLVVFSHDLKKDTLGTVLPAFNRQEEDFSKYLSSPKMNSAYTGKYTLHGSKIEATFSPPYYTNIPPEERVVW